MYGYRFLHNNGNHVKFIHCAKVFSFILHYYAVIFILPIETCKLVLIEKLVTVGKVSVNLLRHAKSAAYIIMDAPSVALACRQIVV